jgi:hypothetical protein
MELRVLIKIRLKGRKDLSQRLKGYRVKGAIELLALFENL